MVDLETWKQAYSATLEDYPERKEHFGGYSDIEYDPLYTPDDVDIDYDEDLGYPGAYPYTRGPYTTMYRSEPWTRRNLIGMRTPKEVNERQKDLIKQGQTGLNFTPDNTFFRGHDTLDVDRELLGKTGTTVDSIRDWRIAFDDIPIDEVSIAINDTDPYTLVAMHFALAEERGIPLEDLQGTTNHSDFLNQYVGSKLFHRFPLEAHERIQQDHIEYCLENVPRWNPVSLVGQNIQQKGATPPQEVAFCIAACAYYVEKTIERGFDPNDFIPRFAFHFNATINVFEEAAKYRAARRVWAKLVTERFDVEPENARLRFHCQTDGVELTQDEALNNIARVAVQTLGPILGGAQSIHTDAYDEALRAPSEDAAQIALRTQQILAEESDVADVIDPLGGSYFLEDLTNQMEEDIWEYLEEVEERGGMMAAVKDGYPQRVMEEAAERHQDEFERGERVIVGVNKFTDMSGGTSIDISRKLEVDDDAIDQQLRRTKELKEERDQEATDAKLEAIRQATKNPDVNIFELVIEAIKAGATNGEIVGVLWDEYGDSEDLIPTYAKGGQ